MRHSDLSKANVRCVTGTAAPGARRVEPPRELLITEECMAEQQPRKAGEYERPATRASRSTALIMGIIAVLVVIILVVLFLL
jgi:hypothetical protein